MKERKKERSPFIIQSPFISHSQASRARFRQRFRWICELWSYGWLAGWTMDNGHPGEIDTVILYLIQVSVVRGRSVLIVDERRSLLFWQEAPCSFKPVKNYNIE